MKIMNMTKRAFLAASVLLLLAGQEAYAQRQLTIIHVNDTHSHLEPERSGERKGKGGVIERAAYRDSVVKADGKRNVLFLHAGDFSQGTSYFTIGGGDYEIDLINALGYDCITLGNHEFDNGVDELARRLSSVKCPVVCANYDFSQLAMGQYVEPCTIIRKAGRKIGIIGLLPDLRSLVSREISSKMPALDNAEAVNSWASYLKEEKKCDLVIVLSHVGYYGDCDLVPQVRNVDLIVGGHSHTWLKEPTIVNDLDSRPVPIVQSGEWGLIQGNIKIR